MVNEYREKLNKAKGSLQLLQKQLKDKKIKSKQLNKRAISIDEAQIFLQKIAQKTQQNLRYRIEDIVQLALDICFPGKYEFIVDFEIKRGKTEACLSLTDDDGNKINPMDATGGGVVDILSFALRIACWSLGNTDNTIVLDEPFKYLSKDLIPKGAEIIKRLSHDLKLQFIIVTHIQELTNLSDKVFHVLLKKGISNVQEIKNDI